MEPFAFDDLTHQVEALAPFGFFVRCGRLMAVVCFNILLVFVSQRVNIPPRKKEKRGEKKVLSASQAEASLCPEGVFCHGLKSRA